MSTWHFLLYAPQINVMFISTYEFWRNIGMITMTIFQIMLAVHELTLTLYFILRWRKLAMLYDMADTNFVLYREKVVTPESIHKIVKEASKPSMVMAGILVFILILVILGWTCPPLILKYSAIQYKKITQVFRRRCRNIIPTYCGIQGKYQILLRKKQFVGVKW